MSSLPRGQNVTAQKKGYDHSLCSSKEVRQFRTRVDIKTCTTWYSQDFEVPNNINISNIATMESKRNAHTEKWKDCIIWFQQWTSVIYQLREFRRCEIQMQWITFLSSASFSVFKTQSSMPIQSVIILLKPGLQKWIHLLGVTPFVLFWNLSGHNCQISEQWLKRWGFFNY